MRKSTMSMSASQCPKVHLQAPSVRPPAPSSPKEPAQRRFLLDAMTHLGMDRTELATRLCVGEAVIDAWLQENSAAQGFRDLEPATWQLVRELLRSHEAAAPPPRRVG